jgi:hypothetical protein
MEGLDDKIIDEQSPDEDERQVMQRLRVPEERIDEQSPDEDERQAMQRLRVPKRKRQVILSGASS